MLIAVLADIALVCYIVYKIKNKQKEKLVEEKQKCIDKFKSEVNDKTKTLQLISSFEKGFDRTDNLMQLLSVLNPLNDDLHNYFDEHTESQYSHEYKKIMSDIPETEKKRFPTTHSEITEYKRKLKSEKIELQKKETEIQSASSMYQLDKLMGKGYKQPLRIVVIGLCIFLVIAGIVNLCLYNSRDYTLWKAKEDCKNNFEIANIIKDNCNVTIENVKIFYENEQNVYIPSYSNNVEYKYSFTAKCEEFSKYYTTNSNSEEAQVLQSKMLEIYNELKPITYKYNHPNGWEVTFCFYGKFTFEDLNGHTYEYDHSLSNDNLATLKVDKTEIS